MDIIDLLASSQNRRDNLLNKNLASDIANQLDYHSIKELVALLHFNNKAVRHDAIKVLYEIGEINPLLLKPYFDIFLVLAESKDNRMQWGAMIAIELLTEQVPLDVLHVLDKLEQIANKGSVITRDNFVRILVQLAQYTKENRTIIKKLLTQLGSAPSNQVPMYAELVLPLIHTNNKVMFQQSISSRLHDMEKESKKLRLQKVLQKIAKIL